MCMFSMQNQRIGVVRAIKNSTSVSVHLNDSSEETDIAVSEIKLTEPKKFDEVSYL